MKYKVISDYLRRNRQFVANEEYCISQMEIYNDIAYLGEMTRLKAIQLEHCNTTFKLIILDHYFYPENIAFAVQKNSPMLPLFNTEYIFSISQLFYSKFFKDPILELLTL